MLITGAGSGIGKGLAGRRVDVLINNAGLQYVANLEDFPQDRWDLLVRVMLNGACMMIREMMLKPMPKGSFISIEELYGILAFLVSDCARNITGQTITVDGGWTVR